MSPRALHPQHLRDLTEGSAISVDVVEERGYYSLGRPEAGRPEESSQHLKELGIGREHRSEPSRYPGLVVPSWSPSGSRSGVQWRPATPAKNKSTGKPIKYVTPHGQPSRLDVHPRWTRDRGQDDAAALPVIRDAAVPLWITEGVKKADALTSRDCCTIALSGVYNWRSQHGTLGEWEDIALKGREVVICFDADARTNANVARAMARLGKWLKSKGADPVRFVLPPAEHNGRPTKGADDYLAAGGTIATLLAGASNKPPVPPSTSDRFTDARMAELVADEVLDGRFIWAAGLGWMAWDGRRWGAVNEKEPVEAARAWAVACFAEAAADLSAGDGNQETVDGWRSMLGGGRLRGALALAAGIVLREASQFDSDPDLLNVGNGIVDLRTGALRPHDPEALCTKLAPADYRPGAEHPDWKAALAAVRDDAQLWLQVRYGQACTGHMTPDDVLVVQQGGGSNGKSTITAAVSQALGDYYGLLSDRVLLANPNDHPTELMDLRGLRFAVMEETPEGRRLNVNRLKKVVGTPQITARHIAKDSVTFDASHSLFVSTNYLPAVEESDHGTWRRLLLLRFPYTFSASVPSGESDVRPGDPGLRERLKAGEEGRSAAVLAWLVQGAALWYASGKAMPSPPTSVVADTADWRGEADVLFSYATERLEMGDVESFVLSTDLLADLNSWLKDRGMREWSDKLMASRLAGHEAFKNVEKARRRVGPGLSRPAFSWAPPPAPTGPATVWLGVRFAS